MGDKGGKKICFLPVYQTCIPNVYELIYSKFAFSRFIWLVDRCQSWRSASVWSEHTRELTAQFYCDEQTDFRHIEDHKIDNEIQINAAMNSAYPGYNETCIHTQRLCTGLLPTPSPLICGITVSLQIRIDLQSPIWLMRCLRAARWYENRCIFGTIWAECYWWFLECWPDGLCCLDDRLILFQRLSSFSWCTTPS